MPTREQVIWIAGFFDGEGCVNIERGYGYSSCLRITISNTVKESLNLIKRWLDFGAVKSHNKGKKYKNQKNGWIFVCYGTNAKNFLELVYPYLIIKKEQANTGLRYYEYYKSSNKRFHTLSKEVIEQREVFNKQMAILNQRGKSNYASIGGA